MIISCQVLPARSACVATSRTGHRSYHFNVWNGSWLCENARAAGLAQIDFAGRLRLVC